LPDTGKDSGGDGTFSEQHECKFTTATMKAKGKSSHGFPLEQPRYEGAPISVPLFGGILVRVGSFLMVDIEDIVLVAQVTEQEDLESKLIRVNVYRSVDGSELAKSIPCLSGIAQDTAEVFQTDEYHDILVGHITNISFVFSDGTK
jgi:hypothetical protein